MIRIILIAVALFFVRCSSNESVTPNKDKEDVTFQKKAKDNEIKVISFNVRYETTEAYPYNNWDYRKVDCVTLIKEQEPTVIGFQEAIYKTQWTYLKEQLSDLYDGYGVGRDDGKEAGESTGILYKKDKVKKIDRGTFWLSPTPDVPTFGWGSQKRRSATWGIFELISNKQRFCYINTHLDLVAQARTESMKMLKSKFKELNPNCYPQILTADFNTTSSDAIFDDFKKEMGNSRNYAPTNKTDDSGTYNNWGKEKSNKEIDMIFFSLNTMNVIEYHTIKEKYGNSTYVSDHYPIYAILSFK